MVAIVEISKILHTSLDKAFQWCTDYSERDPSIAKNARSRRIIKREGNVIYLEDEQLDPSIPNRRSKVTLYPPNKWVGEFEGSIWQGTGTYTLTKHGEDTKLTIVFDMKSMQRDFTSEKLRARAIDIWERYGAAIESELGKR